MKNIMVAALIVLALLAGTANAQNDIEKNKIEFLISSVENLKDAKFIRNGSVYDGQEAANHLRMKLQNVLAVKTADDFIRLIASKSSVSGKPYLIRLPDGKTITSEKYFRDKLNEYRNEQRK